MCRVVYCACPAFFGPRKWHTLATLYILFDGCEAQALRRGARARIVQSVFFFCFNNDNNSSKSATCGGLPRGPAGETWHGSFMQAKAAPLAAFANHKMGRCTLATRAAGAP